MKVTDGENKVIAASQTNAPVSTPFKAFDHLNVLVQVVLSAVTQATGITLKLVESFDGNDWKEVGDESEVSLTSMELDSSTDIANASNEFTSASHGKETGTRLIFVAGTAAPDGLTDGQTYYLINTGTNTFKLANNYKDAIQGNAVTIADDGTGTQTFWDASYEIRMVESDSSDAAQLPVSDLIQVVADTGSGDSITVQDVFTRN